MPTTPPSSWSSFSDVVEAVRAQAWDVVERETAVAASHDGHVIRMAKKVLVVGGGVCFVADNSVAAGGPGGPDGSGRAAELVLQAAALVPVLADDSRQARDLLAELLPDLIGTTPSEVREFLDAPSPAAKFDAVSRTL